MLMNSVAVDADDVVAKLARLYRGRAATSLATGSNPSET